MHEPDNERKHTFVLYTNSCGRCPHNYKTALSIHCLLPTISCILTIILSRPNNSCVKFWAMMTDWQACYPPPIQYVTKYFGSSWVVWGENYPTASMEYIVLYSRLTKMARSRNLAKAVVSKRPAIVYRIKSRGRYNKLADDTFCFACFAEEVILSFNSTRSNGLWFFL